MSNIIKFPGDTSIYRDNEGRHMDTYGQILMIGVFSDLCRYRDSEVEQSRAMELDAIIKHLGKLIERYEPKHGA